MQLGPPRSQFDVLLNRQQLFRATILKRMNRPCLNRSSIGMLGRSASARRQLGPEFVLRRLHGSSPDTPASIGQLPWPALFSRHVLLQRRL